MLSKRVSSFEVHNPSVILVLLSVEFASLSLKGLRKLERSLCGILAVQCVTIFQAKDSEDGGEKRESDPSAAGAEETNLIDLDASGGGGGGGGGSAESVSNGATAADSKEAKKIAMLEGGNRNTSSSVYALTSTGSN